MRTTDNPWTHRVTGGPWPERIGLRCVIVARPAPPAGNVYPWPGRGKDEVIILIEDDPFHRAGDDKGWSCATDRRHITPL